MKNVKLQFTISLDIFFNNKKLFFGARERIIIGSIEECHSVVKILGEISSITRHLLYNP